jgi:2-iminobutanoate/2-iminopropanoate deaminase
MKQIQTHSAPAAIGPYSQAIVSGALLFTSGQKPLRRDGSLVEGGAGVQTQQVFDKLREVIGAAGATLGQVVKTTVSHKNLEDIAAMNGIYAATFGSHCPVRSTVQVARLPRDVLVEIEAFVSLSWQECCRSKKQPFL